MKKSGKKIIVAILLMTMLSQTLYSAAAGIFGLSAQSYAYADDKMTEDVEPGEEVDESTQDDADVVQKAPETESSEGEPATEEESAAEEEEPKLTAGDASETGGAAASDDELIDEDKEVVDEDTKDNKEEEKEAVEIRLRASYVDSATGSAIKDTEDLDIDAGYLYILKGEAPEITGYTYDKTTINIEDEDYDITAILTEDLDGKEIYSITTDTDIEEKDTADVSWTQLVKDAVIVLNYSEGEALVEENTVSDNEAVSENEAEKSVSDNEAVSENEVSENEAEKRVYEYEDDRIKVTATLERADAVPDDAYFDVTPLAEEEAERYLAALNENKGEDDALATADNTLLYNIGFYTDESKSEELEPEEGSVTISFEFKREQLSEELGAEKPEDLVVTHIKEEGSNITTEEVNASASVDEGVIEFDTDSLSTWAIQSVSDGTVTTTAIAEDFDFVASLGRGYDYGIIVSESYIQHVDTETNVMVGYYSSDVVDLGASNNYSNAGGNNFFGRVSSGTELRFYQPPANIYLGSEATKQYKNGDLKITKTNISENTNIHENSDINVGNVISGINSYYSKFYNQGTTVNKPDTGNRVLPKIDLREQPDGVYVIKTDESVLNDQYGPDIWLNQGQRLIINCTSSNIEMVRWHLNGQQPSEYIKSDDAYADWATTAVVFYMPNAKNVKMTESMGVVIAPNAHVSREGGACGGILVCRSTEANNEWHYHNHDLPSPTESGSTAVFEATKTVNGEAATGNSFKFALYEKKNNEWEQIGSEISNDGSKITFPAVSYDKDSATGDHIYKIVETYSGDYTPAADTIYAKVNVSRTTNDNHTQTSVTTPEYYSDEACTEHVSAAFDNQSVNKTEYEFNIWKKFDGPWPADGFTFTLEPYSSKKDDVNYWDENPLMPKNRKITIYKGSDPTQNSGSFGKISFDPETIFNSGKAKGRGSDDHFNNVKGVVDKTHMVYMYTIKEEIPPGAAEYKDANGKVVKYHDYLEDVDRVKYYVKDGIVYDAEPWTLKLWVNAAKVTNGSTDAYIIEFSSGDCHTKTATEESCKREDVHPITFTNRYSGSEYGKIELTKKVLRNGVDSDSNESYNVRLYGTSAYIDAEDSQDFANVSIKSNKRDVVEYQKRRERLNPNNTHDSGRSIFYFSIQNGETITIDGLPVKPGERNNFVIEELFDNEASKPVAIAVQTGSKHFKEEPSGYKIQTLPFTDTVREASATLINKYYYPRATIGVTKEVNGLQTGETWPEKGFGLKLEAIDGAPMPEGDAVIYATSGNTTVSWNSIEYPNTTADYWYQITEDIPAGAKEITVNNKKYMEDADGFLYDPEPYMVKVHVQQGTEPVATVTYHYGNKQVSGSEAATYTNLKKHPTSFTPEATKIIENLSGDEEVKLSFDLYEGDTKIDNVEDQVFKGSGNTTVTFKAISYTAPGVHHYRIVERDSKGAVTDPTNAEITFDVYVEYDANGNLVAKDSNKVVLPAKKNVGNIKNIYPTEDRPFVTVKKILENRGMLDNETFQIKVTKDGQLVTGLQKSVDNQFVDLSNPVDIPNIVGGSESDITIYLPKYTYAQARAGKTDTYHFVEEHKGETINGVKYSTAEYDVKVTPSIEGGKIKFKVEGAEDVKFINTYSASGNAVIKGKKDIPGTALKLKEGDFSFTLSGNGIATQTVSNKADGTFAFDPITYTLDMLEGKETKDFTYKVSEVKPTKVNEGMTYDTNVYDVVVTVRDNHDGTLTTEVKDKGLFATGFINTYEEDGEISFKVVKTMTNWPKGKKFTFYLYDGEKAPENLLDTIELSESDIDPTTEKYVKEFNKKIAAPQVNGQTVPRTYTFEEKVVAEDGIKYDDHPVKTYSVEWKSDDGNGHIQAWKDGAVVNPNKEVIGIGYENSYTAAGEFTPKVEKVLKGSETRLEDFQFELKDANHNRIGEIVTLTTDDKDGQIEFPKLTYQLSDLTQTNSDGYKYDTFEYYIAEVPPNEATKSADGLSATKGGITYDLSDHKLTATVTDNGHGGLDVEASGAGVTTTGLVTITNNYNSKGSVKLQAKKKVVDETGKEIKEGIRLDGTFEFTLLDASGKEISKKSTNANGVVTFDEITYTKDQIKDSPFTYTIKEEEISGKPFRKADDNKPQTVTVSLRDNNDGTITATPSYENDLPEFKNILVGEDTIELDVSKDLDGVLGVTKTFDFELREEGSEDALQTRSITYEKGKSGTKSVSFNALTYNIKDLGGKTSKTYYYQISEVAGNDGVVYDPATYAVKVTISIDNNGRFEARKEVKKYSPITDSWWTNLKNSVAELFNGGPNDEVKFVNHYSPHAEKVFYGRKTLKAGTPITDLSGFKFEIKEGNSVVSKGTSLSDGTISFNKIKYTTEGHHEYTVTEKKKDGYLENTTEGHFYVDVTDNGSGTLVVTPSQNYEAQLNFENTPVELKISKKDVTDESYELKGAVFTLTGDEFNETWTSDGKVKTFYGVKAGDYTLTEDKSPVGFDETQSVSFHLSETGVVTIKEGFMKKLLGNSRDDVEVINNVLTIRDAVKPITISKKDAGYENDLPGAEFDVVNINGSALSADQGSVVENDDGVFTITNLKAGSYKLVETKAPFGYAVAPPILFTISKTRIVTIAAGSLAHTVETGLEGGLKYTSEIQVPDTPIDIFVKKLTTGDNGQGTKQLGGAKLEIQMLNTETNEWVTAVSEFDSAAEGRITRVSDLSPGEYRVSENSAPENYLIAAPEYFTVSANGVITGSHVTKTDGMYYISMFDTPIGTTTFKGHKHWVDGDKSENRPEIKVELQRSYADEDNWTTVAGPITLTGPTYEFSFSQTNDKKDLYERDQQNREYAYRFKETMGESSATYVAENGGILEIKDPATDYELTNTISGNVMINVIKKWQGTDKVSSDEIYKHFTATLRRTVNGKDYEILAKDFEVGKNFETKSFGPYPKYDKDGNEYTYEIIETKGSGNLYSWTGNDTQVKTGMAGSSSVVNLELVNTHPEVPEIPAVIEAEKVVESSTGTDQSKAGFESGLYVKDDSTESGYRMLESKTTDATGKVSFTEIKYNENQVGEHVYYVHEIEPANRRTGFGAYDPNYYPVYVNVTYSDNTHTALKREVRYGTEKSLAPVRITNTYNAKGTVKLILSKDVQTASGNSYWPTGASFTFKVYDNDVYLDGKDVTISSTDSVQFESPEYTEAGPHTYRFEEVIPEEPTAIKYDAQVAPVTVYFRDNNDGTLKPYDGNGNEANLIETGLEVKKFINHYDAKDSIKLSGIKRLDQGTVSDNMFRVSISRNGVALDTVPIVKNGDTGEWSYSENFTLDNLNPETRTATITYDVKEDLTNKINGIIYDETSYTVTVELSDVNKNGHLVVSKTVQKNGQPSDIDTKALDFINTKPGGEDVPIRVTKIVPGTNINDVDDGRFTFILQDDKGNPLGTKDYQKSEHGATFTVRFDPAKVGTSETPTKFEYTVLEKQPEGNDVKQVELGGVTYNYKDGFLYDPTPHKVSVNVWYNPETKKLESEVIYPEGDNKVVIYNPYVTKGEAKVCVGKNLVDYNDPETLIDDEYYPKGGFQFRLYDPETNKYSKVKTISSNGDIAEFTAEDAEFLAYENNTLKFGPNDEETYIKNMTKYYWIEELPNEYGDAFINDSEDRALVEVTLNEENGVINTTVNVKKTNNEEIKKAATDLRGLFARLTGSEKKDKADVWFTNKVKKYGKLTLDGLKKVAYADGYMLDDEGFAEAAKTFGNLRFDVKVSNSKYEESAVGTVDPKIGAISFDKVFEFDETGTYDVAISERWANGQKPEGAKYDLRWDKTPAKFKVDVTDANKDGILEISAPRDKNDNAADVKETTGTNGEYNISFTCTNLLNMNWSIDKIFLGVSANETLTAHLQLLDGKKVIDEWDATANGETVGPDGKVVYSHELTTKQVKLGKTYTLHETAQPKDYVLADDVTVYFAKDGTYILNNDKIVRPMGNPIEMLNAKPDIKYTYVEISKTWEDPYDDTPEKRPTVYARVSRKIKDSNDEFTKYGDPVIIAKQADGTYLARVDGLPANAYINNAYVYYEYKAEEIFTEEMKEAGYEKVDGNNNAYIGSTLSSTEEDANTVRLHNKLEQRYIDIPVRKVWKDGKSTAVHPTITFHLIADGRDTGKKIDLPSGQLEGKFTKLPVYDFSAEKKHEIVYTVTEDPVAGYKPGQAVKNADGSWTFTNESINAKIRKYDANDISAKPSELEGAEFTINKVGGGWSATLKSGQTLEYAIGSASGGIVPGDYEMRETKAPYGYARSAVVAHFTVAADGTVTQTDKWVKSNWNTDNAICFEDKPLYGAYRIIKVDGDTEAPLAGAEFRLYSSKTTNGGSRMLANYIAGSDVVYEAGTYTSGADGRIDIDDLEWGTYYLEETQAPAGYVLPENNVFMFTVDSTQNTPGSEGYLELHYIANDRDNTSSSSSSSSTSSTSGSTSSSSSTDSTSTTSTSSSSTIEAPVAPETPVPPETPGTPGTGSGTTSSSSAGRYLTGVLGSRSSGFLSDVLGVKKAPTSGVLGERMSPVTGDDLTLNFWIMVLCAAGLIAMSFVYSDDEDDEEEGEGRKKAGRRRLRKAKAEKQ